jgi:hypothetical protein
LSITLAYQQDLKGLLQRGKVSLGDITPFELQFILLGGMCFFLPIIMLAGEQVLWSTNPISWNFWMNAAISAPHVTSTYVRLQRKISEGKIHALLGFPLYAGIVALLGLCSLNGHFLEFMTAVNVWQSFHYVRQVYGVSRFYAAKNQESNLTRQLSYLSYHLAMPLFVLGRWSMLFDQWHGKPSDVIIPVHMPGMAMVIFFALAAIAFTLGIAAEIIKFSNQEVYNPAGLINLLAYNFIHCFGFLSTAYYMRGFFAVTIYHAIQYLGLVFILEKSQRKNPPAFLGLWQKSPILVSFLAFWFVLFSFGHILENNILVWFNSYWTQCTAILLGSLSAHHYAVDTFMWRAAVGK